MENSIIFAPDTLAGTSADLPEEGRDPVHFGISLEDAIDAVTEAPAKAVRLNHRIGRIAAGLQSDPVMLTPDLKLDAVYVGG